MGAFFFFFCVCFYVCGRQKPEDPQFEPMADDAITRGGIGLGLLVYIYGVHTQFKLTTLGSWVQNLYQNLRVNLVPQSVHTCTKAIYYHMHTTSRSHWHHCQLEIIWTVANKYAWLQCSWCGKWPIEVVIVTSEYPQDEPLFVFSTCMINVLKHHCRIGALHLAHNKVRNMQRISRKTRVPTR